MCHKRDPYQIWKQLLCSLSTLERRRSQITFQLDHTTWIQWQSITTKQWVDFLLLIYHIKIYNSHFCPELQQSLDQICLHQLCSTIRKARSRQQQNSFSHLSASSSVWKWSLPRRWAGSARWRWWRWPRWQSWSYLSRSSCCTHSETVALLSCTVLLSKF